jgi:membrane associated rhomboid family serine protease
MHAASVGFQCPECVSQGNAAVRQARTIYGGRFRPPTSGIGPITTTLIAANVVLFVVTSVGGLNFASNSGTSSLFERLSLIPPAVGHGQWYRLVTSMFLHFSLIHIGFNMYALFLIGPALEVRLGRWRYLALYFLAGIGGSVLTLIGAPIATEAAGASGAIFGLFAAFYFMARRENLQTGGIVLTIVFNLALSFSFSNEIDWRGHVGGLIVGGILMAILVYAPQGPRRGQLQILGFGIVAVLLAIAGFAGTRHVNSTCEHETNPGSSAAAFCAHYDPDHSAFVAP